MPELDWETVEIDAIREEDFWDLLTSAAADVQEVAISVWRQFAKSDEGTGYTSIEAMVADPGNTMPMRNRLKFFRRKIQVLLKQAHLLSSLQTFGNQTRGHLQHRAFQQRLPECANNYGGFSIYPGSAGDRLGPRSVLDAQSIAFGGRLYPSQNENHHIMISSNARKLTDHFILNVRMTMEDPFTQDLFTSNFPFKWSPPVNRQSLSFSPAGASTALWDRGLAWKSLACSPMAKKP